MYKKSFMISRFNMIIIKWMQVREYNLNTTQLSHNLIPFFKINKYLTLPACHCIQVYSPSLSLCYWIIHDQSNSEKPYCVPSVIIFRSGPNIYLQFYQQITWWRRQMEIFSGLLALCEGKPLVTGGRPMTRRFAVFLDLRLNKRLSKQSRCWWFVMQWR